MANRKATLWTPMVPTISYWSTEAVGGIEQIAETVARTLTSNNALEKE